MKFEQAAPFGNTIAPFNWSTKAEFNHRSRDVTGLGTTTRRAIQTAIGSLLFTPFLVGQSEAKTDSHYRLVQGEKCVQIQPIRGRQPVDQFYEYRLPEPRVTDENGGFVGSTTRYASAGTAELQRSRTSIAFLYRGPSGLSLVFVHGDVDSPDGGAVTFRISGLPETGAWVVKDDLYRDPEDGELADTNYDRWRVEGSTHRIDWTWGRNGTDGGVFRELGDEFDVAVRPAFNEAALLYGDHFDGRITDWEFLSGSNGAERIPLALDQPLRIQTGSCG